MAALLEAYGEERAEELLRAYEKLSELAAAGKLKGKASEWDAKLKAVQAVPASALAPAPAPAPALALAQPFNPNPEPLAPTPSPNPSPSP